MVLSDQASKKLSSDLERTLNAEFWMGKNGNQYAILKDKSNRIAVKMSSRKFSNYVSMTLEDIGRPLKSRELTEYIERCKAIAEQSMRLMQFHTRVSPLLNGIVIDRGDVERTQFSVNESGVEIIQRDSTEVFESSNQSIEFPLPVLEGKENFFRLRKYLNLNDAEKVLLIAWISYVLAHPKTETAKFPILVLFGSQGYGKSFLSKLLICLIDPSTYGLRVMPKTPKELAIMTNSSHVIAFDNIRFLTNEMSDALCMASTGGNFIGRQLYTDADINSIRLHAAIILNGIHQFISQPDLAQRCIQLNLLPIDQSSRKSDAELMTQLEREIPHIFGGLLQYISAIFAALPDAKVINPERMIDFSQWLSAMEFVDQVPPGVYQGLYSILVQEGQREVLHDNLLGDALYAFGMKQQYRPWVGTSTELLKQLNADASPEILRSSDWPKNAISLSRKIAGIKAPLEALGVLVSLSRGKLRNVTIELKEGMSDLY